MAISRTNAVRLLKRMGIRYGLREFDMLSISAGMRGLQILLSPADYIRVVNARVAPIASDKDPT